MKARILILILLVGGLLQANGQTERIKVPIDRLRVGDTIPEYIFKTIMNSPHSKAKISDFRGKLLLLDFWATWCVYCIADFPKMMELQSKFGDKIQVMLVNQGEDAELIDRFLRRRKQINGIQVTLPIAVGDTLLTNVWFKGNGLPHYAWIDKAGVVRNITSSTAVSEPNIENFLAGKEIYDVEVVRGTESFKRNLRRFTVKSEFETENKDLLWFSEWYSEIEALPSYSRLLVARNGMNAVSSMNSSIKDLYRFAWGKLIRGEKREKSWVKNFPVNRTFMEAEGFDPTDSLSLNERNTPLFCYRLIAAPFTKLEKLQQRMLLELDNFGYSSRMEKRKVKCLVLSAQDTVRLMYKNGNMTMGIKDLSLTINNVTIQRFIDQTDEWAAMKELNFLPPYPIIDETGFKGKLGRIEIEGILIGDPRALGKALVKYGLSLELKYRDLDILILTKKSVLVSN